MRGWGWLEPWALYIWRRPNTRVAFAQLTVWEEMTGTPPRPFALSVETSERHALVHVTGEVDLETAADLKSRLLALADDGAQYITVDLADTDFIDSTGLHALVVALRMLREQGGDLVLQSPSRNAARVLELSGLSTVVRVV